MSYSTHRTNFMLYKGKVMKFDSFFTACRECKFPERHPGCHDTCKKYLLEREAYNKAKAQAEKEALITRLLFPNGKNHRT